MISKIELKEVFNSYNNSLFIIDLANQSLIQIQNAVIIKQEKINIDIEELIDLVKKHITYWDNQYIDNTVIGGTQAELNIYTSDELIKYNFINKYPFNYNEFIKSIKEMVAII